MFGEYLPNMLIFDVKQVNSVYITVLQLNMVLLITICIVSIIDFVLAFYRIVVLSDQKVKQYQIITAFLNSLLNTFTHYRYKCNNLW